MVENRAKGKLTESDLEDLSQKLIRMTVPADSNGGGPLWAINGVVFKAHGRSQHLEVAATVGNAKKVVEMDIVGSLKQEMDRVKSQMLSHNS
jgi:fatty acid/phospholipid biosynthesis enzyme